MSFGLHYCPPKPGIGVQKLTPYRLVCCAACFVIKQAVGDADRGDNCPDTARALHQGQTVKEIARDLKVSRNTVRKVLRSGGTSSDRMFITTCAVAKNQLSLSEKTRNSNLLGQRVSESFKISALESHNSS
jgi:hypothetical protein